MCVCCPCCFISIPVALESLSACFKPHHFLLHGKISQQHGKSRSSLQKGSLCCKRCKGCRGTGLQGCELEAELQGWWDLQLHSSAVKQYRQSTFLFHPCKCHKALVDTGLRKMGLKTSLRSPPILGSWPPAWGHSRV